MVYVGDILRKGVCVWFLAICFVQTVVLNVSLDVTRQAVLIYSEVMGDLDL